ncbi:MAG: mannonate dehydratase [Spirochaetales bacterium]|nr:mannonate dehydratase [Spirochaetales bacterium]
MSERANKSYKKDRVRAGMRWFGPEDVVTIRNIRQTPGITNIISALHHIAPGEVWTEEEVAKRKIEVEFLPSSDAPADLKGKALYDWYGKNGEKTGLYWCTAESLVFTEEIKNGSPERDKHIENYKESLKNLGKFGVTEIVGNFMLVADWTRTDLVALEDGSKALEYEDDAFMAFDIYVLKRHDTEEGYIEDGSYSAEDIAVARDYWENTLSKDDARREALTKMITAGLPGAQEGFTLEDFRAAVGQYKNMSVEDLRENIAYFLDKVVPVGKDAGVRLCCHADDPAFSPFLGTPRAVGDVEGYKFLLDHGCGVNLCIGSLLPREQNREITSLVYQLADYGKSLGLDIHDVFPHVHLRPIETEGRHFREGHHAEHREELAQVVFALLDVGWRGVFRPDHAPSPDHGFGRPGYDLVGRGYGAQVLLGLFEMGEIMLESRDGALKAALAAAKDGEEAAALAFHNTQMQLIQGRKAYIKKPWVFGKNGI